jgi:hypothetical protein
MHFLPGQSTSLDVDVLVVDAVDVAVLVVVADSVVVGAT